MMSRLSSNERSGNRCCSMLSISCAGCGGVIGVVATRNALDISPSLR